jgi:hypothetical protein
MKLLFLLTSVLLTSFAVQAQLPQKFNYQAVVRSNAGTIVANQNVRIRFSIHDGTATGPVQYSETHSATTNVYGLINLQVGAGNVISGHFAGITWNTGNKFLEVAADITGGTNYTILSTVELITVPYALQTENANRFSGALSGDVSGSQNSTVIQPNAVTTAKIADSSITASKIAAGQTVRSINGLKDDITLAAGNGTSFSTTGNTITITGTGGDITGITPGPGLTGGGTSDNIIISANFGGNGVANSVSRSDHNHVGQSWTTNTGSVLTMYDNSTSGIALNVYSYGTGYNAAAVSGQVLATTGQSVGVFGSTSSNDAYGAGVFGQATRAGNAKGVWGYAPGNNTFAIYGDGAGANSWAGYFQGRVHVNGTLSKAAGSFKIDHPLDPANKYLSHSFVESPDMMNIYNGNVTLDANGAATVTLPDWFEALNNNFRYQLTAIGKASPNVYIAQEIAGNRFRIAGGAPGGKISWMVTGVRHDAYANAHRIPVEEPKPVNERGTYLNPQSAGKSVKQGLVKPAPLLRTAEMPTVPSSDVK